MALNDFLSSGNRRLDLQLRFSAEIDKMTSVLRQTLLLDRSRRENDAEHSWHIAVMALFFSEYTVEKVDVPHSVEMLIIHDLVEIYAGDTFAYDHDAIADKADRELAAADRLFAQLPPEQGEHIRNLWNEFENCSTPESRYANCLDRLQPFLHNTLTDGHTWQHSRPRAIAAMVRKRMSLLQDFMPEVFLWVEKNIERAVRLQQLLP